MAISVEDARALLREQVRRSSLNAVAARVGINRSTLRTFIADDGVQKPIGRVLEPILAYAERYFEPAIPHADPLGSDSVGEERVSPPRADPDVLHGRSADFWEGRQSLALELMEYASGLLKQAADMHGRAVRAQREIHAATVPVPREQIGRAPIPETINGVPITEHERRFFEIMRAGGEEVRARLEAAARETAEDASTRTPPAKGRRRA